MACGHALRYRAASVGLIGSRYLLTPEEWVRPTAK